MRQEWTRDECHRRAAGGLGAGVDEGCRDEGLRGARGRDVALLRATDRRPGDHPARAGGPPLLGPCFGCPERWWRGAPSSLRAVGEDVGVPHPLRRERSTAARAQGVPGRCPRSAAGHGSTSRLPPNAAAARVAAAYGTSCPGCPSTFDVRNHLSWLELKTGSAGVRSEVHSLARSPENSPASHKRILLTAGEFSRQFSGGGFAQVHDCRASKTLTNRATGQ